MFTPSFTTVGIFALGLINAASGHMIMQKPVPYDVENTNNSPLDPSGSDYPCKASSYKITAMNKIPVNEPVLLDFKGTAVHGGGTCQLSISLDKEPTKESTFKVIQTFVGGCPTVEGTGGLTFNIPKDFPSTERATLAWTWFNQIGNREMYMNCAPVEITGGSDNMDYFNTLPDMFVANIAGISQYTTAESTDAEIPNAGNFVIQSKDAKPGPVGGAAGAVQKSQVGSASNLAAYGAPAKDSNVITYVDGSGAGADAGGSNAGSGASPSTPANGGNNGLYTPTQPSTTAVAPPSTFSTLTVPAISTPSAPVPVPSGALDRSPSTCTEGQVVCGPDGSTWGLCNFGKVILQPCAPGTKCSGGVISKRSDHVRRGAHGAHKVRAA